MSRLHRAARMGKEDEIAEALAQGANIDALSIRGFTPLMIAAQEGHVGVTRQLLAAGADLHLATVKGRRTALHIAASAGHLGVVQELVAYGADVNVLAGKSTPVLDAARVNHREVALFLKQHGADAALKGDRNLSADEWLELGGVFGRDRKLHPEGHFPRTPERIAKDEAEVRKQMAREASADEYAALHGRHILVWSYGSYTYNDPVVATWARRVAEIVFTPGLLAEVEERFLSGDTREEARKLRARRAKSLERFRRKHPEKQP